MNNYILNPRLERYHTPLVIQKQIVQCLLFVYAVLPLFSAWAFALIPKCKDIVIKKYKYIGSVYNE